MTRLPWRFPPILAALLFLAGCTGSPTGEKKAGGPPKLSTLSKLKIVGQGFLR